MPAQPLTQDELAAAAKLKALFIKWQQKQKAARVASSQEAAAQQLEFGQSALNQYLNGKIPLNVETAIKFAAMLDCPVSAFSQALADQVSKYAAAVEGQVEAPADAMDMDSITRHEMKVVTMYRLASVKERQLLDGIINDISLRVSASARNKT